jgi:hypothetical protein
MRLPVLRGVIARRILVNYRCDPAAAARLLPAPLRPLEVRGHALVGLCLIRLEAIRPRGFPAWTGMTSENVAHRVAVAWDEAGATRTGVHVIRRDTSSRLNALAGGVLVPGSQHQARFEVWESERRFKIAARSLDDGLSVRLAARLEDDGAPGSGEAPGTQAMAGSIFASVAESSSFFAAGALGWSASADGRLEGLELRTEQWNVTPLFVERIESAYFDDPDRFPRGSITFDHALLMRGIEHEWRARSWTAGAVGNRVGNLKLETMR